MFLIHYDIIDRDYNNVSMAGVFDSIAAFERFTYDNMGENGKRWIDVYFTTAKEMTNDDAKNLSVAINQKSISSCR